MPPNSASGLTFPDLMRVPTGTTTVDTCVGVLGKLYFALICSGAYHVLQVYKVDYDLALSHLASAPVDMTTSADVLPPCDA